MKLVRTSLIILIVATGLAACSSDGDGGDSSPKIPDNAQVFSAEDVSSLSTFVGTTGFDLAVSSFDLTYLAAQDIGNCAILSGDDMDTDLSGTATVSFADCAYGDASLNGTLTATWVYRATNVSGSGEISVNGNLQIAGADDTITISDMNIHAAGSDDVNGGSATVTIAFVVQSDFNGGYVVTTPQPISISYRATTNLDSVQIDSGELLLSGGANTRIKISVKDDAVYFDNGSGVFSQISNSTPAIGISKVKVPPVPAFLR